MRLECSCRSSPERSTSSTGGRRAGSELSSAVSSAASVGRPCPPPATDSRRTVPRRPPQPTWAGKLAQKPHRQGLATLGRLRLGSVAARGLLRLKRKRGMTGLRAWPHLQEGARQDLVTGVLQQPDGGRGHLPTHIGAVRHLQAHMEPVRHQSRAPAQEQRHKRPMKHWRRRRKNAGAEECKPTAGHLMGLFLQWRAAGWALLHLVQKLQQQEAEAEHVSAHGRPPPHRPHHAAVR